MSHTDHTTTTAPAHRLAQWGRTPSGRSPLPGALAIGIVISGGIALAGALLQRDWVFGILLLDATITPACLMGWAVVVDRSSIPGAPHHPEQAVESSWYDRATRGAFHDLLIVIGVFSLALAVVPAFHDVSALTALCLVTAFAALDTGIRYQLLKGRES